MALEDMKVFDVSVREKSRIKRMSNGNFVVYGGCENSRFAADRYLRFLAFIEASSGRIILSDSMQVK